MNCLSLRKVAIVLEVYIWNMPHISKENRKITTWNHQLDLEMHARVSTGIEGIDIASLSMNIKEKEYIHLAVSKDAL